MNETLDPAAVASLLVVAPHPDDETIGAGGLAHAVALRGGRVRVVVATNGAGSHPGSRTHPPGVLARVREAESRAACARLGVEDVRFCGLADGGSSGWGADRGGLAKLAAAVSGRWALALLPSRRDNHMDHRKVRELAGAHVSAERTLDYLVWPLEPGTVVDAPPPGSRRGTAVTYTLSAADVAAKREAMACYRSQLGMIVDSAQGFSIDARTLARFLAPVERFTS